MSLLSFIFSHVSDSPTKSNLLSRDLRLHSIFSKNLEILLQFIDKVERLVPNQCNNRILINNCVCCLGGNRFHRDLQCLV